MEHLKGMIYTDLPVRFPFTSSRGHKYLFVLYDYDLNAILAEPIKSQSAEELVRGYTICYNKLINVGVISILQRLDNEASKELIAAIQKNNIAYQLASPGNHRLNPAERAIQTFKNHFISVLNSTDSNFPSHLWCRLVDQAVMTLNMLHTSCIKPMLSAHTQLFGVFNFDRTPLAPLGIRAMVHEHVGQRMSWGDHGKEGWYIGPALQHYRN